MDLQTIYDNAEFEPTAEQKAIVEAAANTDDNLAVVARAGAAKTSTLVLMAQALPSKEVLTLAFNKKIAEEMQERLPDNCTAKTLHQVGYAAWRGYVSRFPKLDMRKMYFIVKNLIEDIADKEEKQEAYEVFSEILDICKEAKSSGYLPESAWKGKPWKPLIRSDDNFYLSLPMEPFPIAWNLAKQALKKSFDMAFNGSIDFDDMIYCPAMCGVSWPSADVVMVDEAQDLSALNHHILKKIVRNKRLIAVGDPLQAIYGFRGASETSMRDMAKMFNTVEYRLTTSFRCGKAIVENAKWLATDMNAASWAVDGEVHNLESWDASQVQIGDAIICRNNAPLFSIAIRLIESGLLPEIAGRDVGAPLVKIMKKLGKPKMLTLAAISALEDWEKRELRRARNGAVGQIKDKAQIIRLMLEKTETLGDAIAYLEHLLARDGRIHLMTGHKSKGLEFDRVWFLDQTLCDIKRGQDANIKYVIETRAKKFLAYVTSDTFVGAEA